MNRKLQALIRSRSFNNLKLAELLLMSNAAQLSDFDFHSIFWEIQERRHELSLTVNGRLRWLNIRGKDTPAKVEAILNEFA